VSGLGQGRRAFWFYRCAVVDFCMKIICIASCELFGRLMAVALLIVDAKFLYLVLRCPGYTIE
jgi:hypothetical protein